MRVTMNNGIHNKFANITHMYRNDSSPKREQQDQKDAVWISPFGKANSIVESLMKQRQNIIDNKNELIGRTLVDGKSLDSIKTQLDNYDEQMKGMESQIAQIAAETAKQQNAKQESMIYSEPKTEDDFQTERLSSVIYLSSSLNQVQVVSAVKTGLSGEAKALEAEIRLDESRGLVPVSKKERLSDIQKQSADLSARMSEDFIKVNEEIKGSSDSLAEKRQNAGTTDDRDLNISIEWNQALADKAKRLEFS